MLTEQSKLEWTQKIKKPAGDANYLILERLALQQATREIYRLYKVAKIMASEWRDMGCDDQELIAAQTRRVANKVGQPADEVLEFLANKVSERAKVVMLGIDGGSYTAALTSSETLCTNRIIDATSEKEANEIFETFSRFAYGFLCGSLRRDVKPLHIDDLARCGKNFPRVAVRTTSEISSFEFSAEDDDEIPF